MVPNLLAFESAIIKKTRGFGFGPDWRPCSGFDCRFEVFTAVDPVCPEGRETCGRAEKIRVSYVIKSRLNRKSVFGERELILSGGLGLDKDPPIEVQVKDATLMEPPLCADPDAALLAVSEGKRPDCYLPLTHVKSACEEASPAGMLGRLGVCASTDECSQVCGRVRSISEAPCSSTEWQPDFWTPDLLRCERAPGMVFLDIGRSEAREFTASSESPFSWLLDKMSTTIGSAPVCFFRTQLCIGARSVPSAAPQLLGFLPIRESMRPVEKNQ
jgi:hypothetical protein